MRQANNSVIVEDMLHISSINSLKAPHEGELRKISSQDPEAGSAELDAPMG